MSEAQALVQGSLDWESVVEWSGLFWLGAEWVILWLVIQGRQYLAQGRLGDVYDVCMSALGWLVLFGVLVWVARNVGLSNRDQISGNGHHPPYARSEFSHLLLWSSFVFGWVLLEVLIVYHGCRAFRILQQRLGKTGEGPYAPPFPTATFLLLALFVGGTALVLVWPYDHQLWNIIMSESAKGADPDNFMDRFRNGVYLILRLAGIVWIAVEWFAAVYLIRGYLLLRNHLPVRKVVQYG